MPVIILPPRIRYRGAQHRITEHSLPKTVKLLLSCYLKAGRFETSVFQVVIFLLAILPTPLAALAQNVGDLSPHPYSSNGMGNPFNPGGAYSLNPPALAGGRGPAAPTSPYTWSNVSPRFPALRASIVQSCLDFPQPPPAPRSRPLSEDHTALPSQRIILWPLEGNEEIGSC